MLCWTVGVSIVLLGVTSKYDFKELKEQGILNGNTEDYGYLNADISVIAVGRSGDLSVLRKYTNFDIYYCKNKRF